MTIITKMISKWNICIYLSSIFMVSGCCISSVTLTTTQPVPPSATASETPSYSQVNAPINTLMSLRKATPTAIPTRRGKFINYGVALKSISTFDALFSLHDNDRVLYGVTRSGEYCRLYRYNLRTNSVDLSVPILDAKAAETILQEGNSIYIGTQYPAALYRYDIVSGILTKVAVVDSESYTWNLKQDGRFLLLGTYPSARIYRYNMDTGLIENLGSFSQEQDVVRSYVRSLEIYKHKIYAGLGARAGLIEYDVETGSKANILPTEYSDDSFVSSLVRMGSKLFIGMSPSYRILVFDLETRHYTLLMQDALNTHEVTIPSFSPDVIHFRGISDFFFEYDTNTNVLTRLLPGGLAAGEIIGNTFVAGVNRDAVYVEIAFDGTVLKSSFLTEVGLEPQKVAPTSMAAFDNKVFLGERQLRIFDTVNGTEVYRMVSGEPKAMCGTNGSLFSAEYTGAMLYRYPEYVIHNPKDFNFADPAFIILDIGDNQNRPKVIWCGHRYVLIGTEPDYGQYGGALTYYSIASGEWYTSRNIVQNHTILSIAHNAKAESDQVYLGTSVYGGTGTNPLSEDAHLVKFDLRSRAVVFDIIPQTNNAWIGSLACHGELVYAVMENGSLYAIDSASGHTVATNTGLSLKQILASIDGNLYAITNNNFVRIDKRTLAITILKDLPNLGSREQTSITEDSLTGVIYFISGFELWAYL